MHKFEGNRGEASHHRDWHPAPAKAPDRVSEAQKRFDKGDFKRGDTVEWKDEKWFVKTIDKEQGVVALVQYEEIAEGLRVKNEDFVEVPDLIAANFKPQVRGNVVSTNPDRAGKRDIVAGEIAA